MIKIIENGQVGQTKLIIDMLRTRARIFRDRMKWDVEVDHMNLESDEYDLPEAFYILSLNEEGRVIGTWRFLPTNSSSMIKNIWPAFTQTLNVPESALMVEASRFGVNLDTTQGRFGSINKEETEQPQCSVSDVTAEMIVALIDISIKCGITDMYTMYACSVKRLLDRIGFTPSETSKSLDVEGEQSVIARFKLDYDLLNAVKQKTGINSDIQFSELPPNLKTKYLQHEKANQSAERVRNAA